MGIESSCDETAAAVVGRDGTVHSNVIASQIALHGQYGGVVPELASREHLRNIGPVVHTAMREAGCGFGELAAIAVTEGPGLAGALLVGLMYAKGLALSLGKPLIAVNHLEGHIHAVLLDAARLTSPLPQPILALVVSGGHTHLYIANVEQGSWRYRNIGRTVDDAAGEAFDKVAKLLGLGYPGGPWIEALAAHGNAAAVPFGPIQVKPKAHRKAAPETPQFLFSFSGLKTAVLRYVQTHPLRGGIDARRAALASAPGLTPAEVLPLCDAETLNLMASFQRAVVEDLVRKTFAAAEMFQARAVLVSGGVAANNALRRRFVQATAERGLPVAFPGRGLATDNAAMIAAAAWPRLLAGELAPLELTAEPSLRLGG